MTAKTQKERGAMFSRLKNRTGKKTNQATPLSRKTAPQDVVKKALEEAGLKVVRVGSKTGRTGEFLRIAVEGQCVPKDEKGSVKIDSPEYQANEELRRRTVEAIVKLRPGKDPISIDDAKASVVVEIVEPKGA
jgi:ribosome maturation protein Sdo1